MYRFMRVLNTRPGERTAIILVDDINSIATNVVSRGTLGRAAEHDGGFFIVENGFAVKVKPVNYGSISAPQGIFEKEK
jgi:hypothetical protein